MAIRRLLNCTLQKWFITTRKYSQKYYGSGITYSAEKCYQRLTDDLEPTYEATKLFLVMRTQPVKGNSHWEKTILKHFKLDVKESAIVKNLPENNAKLFRIKHLVKITPIYEGRIEEDINCTFIDEDSFKKQNRKI